MPIDLTRRAVLQGLCASAFITARAEAGVAHPNPPPLRLEDYAVARQSFRTHLTRIGPSPDEPETLDPPPGAERISYRSDGRDLAAWLAPPTGVKQPGVIFLHGGNVLSRDHWELTRAYREAGYAVIMPALRGENGQAGAFSGFYDENADVLAAASAFAGLPGIDRARIFVAGHSIGGTQTLLAAMSTPLFRGAASFSGYGDAWAFFARYPEDICFDSSSHREYEMRSPLCFAASFKCPVRMFYGRGETRLAEPTRLTVERAVTAGLDVRAEAVPGDHFTSLPEETAKSLGFFASL